MLVVKLSRGAARRGALKSCQFLKKFIYGIFLDFEKITIEIVVIFRLIIFLDFSAPLFLSPYKINNDILIYLTFYGILAPLLLSSRQSTTVT